MDLAPRDNFQSATVEPSVVDDPVAVVISAHPSPTVAAGHHNTVWTLDQEIALVELVGAKHSFRQAAARLNAKFDTSYSRNALIGKAKRMGLECPNRPGKNAAKEKKTKQHKPRLVFADSNGSQRRIIESVENAEAVKLRCVDIVPRHLSVLDLKLNDCRYPYGGDNGDSKITFCGHVRLEGSSYCFAHKRLTSSYSVAISDAEHQRRRQRFADTQRKRATA